MRVKLTECLTYLINFINHQFLIINLNCIMKAEIIHNQISKSFFLQSTLLVRYFIVSSILLT